MAEKISKSERLNEVLTGRVRSDVILAPFTSFGIGGQARYFFVAITSTDIVRAVRAAREMGLKFFVLGGGSNILFDDAGYTGLVIKDETDKFRLRGNIISALSGAILDKMVDATVEAGLGGLEYAAGIRGTIGGAVYGNAGAFGHAINEILKSAVVYTGDDRIEIVDSGYFKFEYRKSRLSESEDLVLSVKLQLHHEDKARLTEIVNERRRFREERHPVGLGTAGSVFKNLRSLEDPANVTPAGKILEDAGVRGMVVGDAAVFEKHCNIVVNRGNATSGDVKRLVQMMGDAAKGKFGIDLEKEIMYIDP
ncbi:MAG: UDP-N-acetylmuramate dehydrogenase [candidate division Zixibacteria bacterium]